MCVSGFYFGWHRACVNIGIAYEMRSELGKEHPLSHIFNANGLPTDIEFNAPALQI